MCSLAHIFSFVKDLVGGERTKFAPRREGTGAREESGTKKKECVARARTARATPSPRAPRAMATAPLRPRQPLIFTLDLTRRDRCYQTFKFEAKKNTPKIGCAVNKRTILLV